MEKCIFYEQEASTPNFAYLRYVGYLDGRGAVGNTGAYDFYGVRP
jgi:hypothetical protein